MRTNKEEDRFMAGYGMSIKLNGTIEGIKEHVVEALKTQGFGVITE
jgi:hypothetical protein